MIRVSAGGIRTRTCLLLSAFFATTLAGCGPQAASDTAQAVAAPAVEANAAATPNVPAPPKPAGDGPINPPGGHPLDGVPDADEFGEFLANPTELANYTVNEIARSIRLNGASIALGKGIYDKNCASCHGADMKGSKEAHAPDLTDAEWRYSGDDLPSGGDTKQASDVEWTVKYGVRSGNPYARGVEADMLAFDPQYRNEHDLGDYGKIKTVDDKEIDQLAEYVLQLGGQKFDRAKATAGKKLFLDNAKGNCGDCHTDEATGNPALGSTNLTKPNLYLYGSDKTSIVESITKGRAGTMPEFGKTLKPEELKAVSVYVFTQAKLPPPLPVARR